MKLSIIIPVFKEGSKINDQIEHINSQISRDVDYEIIVSDGEHSTLNHIKDSNIIKIKSQKGRGRGLIDGVKQSSGDILAFIHSDTKMPKKFDLLIMNKINNGFDAGAFDLSIDSNKFIFRVIEKISSLRSRLSRIPYGDQSIFSTKKAYNRIGGFEDFPLMEDVNFMQKLKKNKYNIGFIDEKVKTSSRRWDQEGFLYVTIRNWILVSCYYLGVKPEKLVNWYTGFKNLKLFK